MKLKSPETVTSSHLPICICSPICSQMAEPPQYRYHNLPGDMVLFCLRLKANKKLILILNRLQSGLWFHFNISTAAWDHFWAEKELQGEDMILPCFFVIPALWTMGDQGSYPVWFLIHIAHRAWLRSGPTGLLRILGNVKRPLSFEGVSLKWEVGRRAHKFFLSVNAKSPGRSVSNMMQDKRTSSG